VRLPLISVIPVRMAAGKVSKGEICVADALVHRHFGSWPVVACTKNWAKGKPCMCIGCAITVRAALQMHMCVVHLAFVVANA